MEASTCTTSMFSPKGVWGLDGAGDLLTREGRGFTVQWVERRNSGHWSLIKRVMGFVCLRGGRGITWSTCRDVAMVHIWDFTRSGRHSRGVVNEK